MKTQRKPLTLLSGLGVALAVLTAVGCTPSSDDREFDYQVLELEATPQTNNMKIPLFTVCLHGVKHYLYAVAGSGMTIGSPVYIRKPKGVEVELCPVEDHGKLTRKSVESKEMIPNLDSTKGKKVGLL